MKLSWLIAAITLISVGTGDQTVDLIKEAGYPVEVYDIYTVDGYQIRLQRIPNERESVLLVHGILTNAAQWVLQGKHQSLAFMLSDAGFDVWLFNARGTRHSLGHKLLHHYMRAYWDFSWSDIATADIPAAINYIRTATGNQRITYIGHSQGCATGLVLLSTQPAFNNKIASMHFLSPAVFVSNMTSSVASLIPLRNFVYNLMMNSGIYAYMPDDVIEKYFRGRYCENASNQMCKNIIIALVGDGAGETNMDEFVIQWPKYVLDGSSVKQMLHYGQIAASGKFAMFDYGDPIMNGIFYGQMIPPEYNLTAVTAPLYIYYGTKDALVPSSGSEKLISMLTNVKKVVALPYNHVDTLFSKHIGVTINQQILYNL